MPEPSTDKRCASCGYSVPAGWVVCAKCGAPANDCKHGYRAAGGTYDCPACEVPDA